MSLVLLWVLITATFATWKNTSAQEMNTDYQGHVLEERHADNWRKCSEICTYNKFHKDFSGGEWIRPGDMAGDYRKPCRVWIFREADKRCFLKGPKSATRRFQPLQGHIAGMVGCEEIDINYPGHDIAVEYRKNWHECGLWCIEDSRCEFWTFRETDKYCFLKEINVFGKRRLQWDNVSGRKGCTASSTCPQNNIDYHPGHDIKHGAVEDWYECSQACKSNSGCYVWTYVKEDKYCFLKNAEALKHRVKNEACVSGLQNCPGTRCGGNISECCESDIMNNRICDVGEGDCDLHHVCGPNLECGNDNCPWNPWTGDDDDCCRDKISRWWSK